MFQRGTKYSSSHHFLRHIRYLSLFLVNHDFQKTFSAKKKTRKFAGFLLSLSSSTSSFNIFVFILSEIGETDIPFEVFNVRHTPVFLLGEDPGGAAAAVTVDALLNQLNVSEPFSTVGQPGRVDDTFWSQLNNLLSKSLSSFVTDGRGNVGYSVCPFASTGSLV